MMKTHRFLSPAFLLPGIIGIAIGGLLFIVGATEDAPGMCAIGLSIGFVSVMLGLNWSGMLRKGMFATILLFGFGVFIALLTTSILFDGEFEDRPWLSLVGFALSAVLLSVGFLRRRKRGGGFES